MPLQLKPLQPFAAEASGIEPLAEFSRRLRSYG